MKTKICRACLSYDPDDSTPGFGTCAITDCQVNECDKGCLNWAPLDPNWSTPK